MHDRQPQQATEHEVTLGDASATGVGARTHQQLVLREVNDRIAELSGWNETGFSLFVCECSDPGCAEPLEISAAEYEQIRADNSRFVVLPGHEQPEFERVVNRNGRFVVVENRALTANQEQPTVGRVDG